MAIGLDDVKRNRLRKSNDVRGEEKDRSLRPWEGYDKLGLQLRTANAKLAVRKAREISEKNDEKAQELLERNQKLRSVPVAFEDFDKIDDESELTQELSQDKKGLKGKAMRARKILSDFLSDF